MAENVANPLRTFISKTLLSLSPHQLDRVMDQLDELGVDDLDYLQYVEASQLSTVLKPVHISKLLATVVSALSGAVVGQSSTSMLPCTPQQPSSSLSFRSPLATPNSASEPNLLSTPRRETPSNNNWAAAYSVPWEEVPCRILDILKQGKKLPKGSRFCLVRSIIGAVRKTCNRPMRKDLAFIAQKMVLAYPETLREELEGDVIGSGYDSLLAQLVARVENEHRTASLRTASKDEEVESESVPLVSTTKRRKKDKYGCVLWQPSSLPDGETSLSQAQHQLSMVEMYESMTWDQDLISLKMKAAYCSQRTDINSGMSSGIIDLKRKWPFLFEPRGLLIHCEELLGFNVCDYITDSLASKGQRIIGYMASLKNKLVSSTLAAMHHARGQLSRNESEAPAIILCVLQVMSEETTSILKLCDEAASPADVESVVSLTPCLVGCGSSLMTASRFMLVIDGKVVHQNITVFTLALSMLFASFFVFNIEYPQEASCTLEFIQRCLCRLNPPSGSKAVKAKRQSSTSAKVLSLLNSIAEFEWLG